MIKLIKILWYWFNAIFEFLTPFGDLTIRLWIANVYFKSGWLKLTSPWSSTLALFQQEYHVPILSPTLAALLGTSVELIIPIFLVLGLGGRIPALILFVFNIMIVISYPYLLTPDGWVGLKDHIHWGLLIMVILLHGYGKISLDYLISKKFESRENTYGTK